MAQNPMMDNAGVPPEMPETPVEESSDQGYVIEITVKSDGSFIVSKEDLQQEAVEENAVGGPGSEPGAQGEEGGDSYPSLGAALKAVIKIVQENPVGESEQAGFEAGFGAKKPQMAGGMMGGM